MKRLLLVLLVLGMSVPAIADVFVYNLRQSGVKFEYDADANNGNGAWFQSPSNGYKYFVIQVDEINFPGSVNIWSVDTYKVKGDPCEYYTVNGSDTINFLQTPIAKKMMWIAEGTFSSDESRVMLSGPEKLTKIGSQKYTVANTLSGYFITGDIINSQEIKGGKMSWTLNSKITKALVSSNANVAGAIDTYFQGLGYVPD